MTTVAAASGSKSAFRLAGVALLLALPIAWLAAKTGFGVPVREPLRDVAALALWSVAEEVVFRGALQPAIARASDRGARTHRGGITPANALTSLLFALFHLWRHPPLAAALVFPVSLVYGRLRELSGRVWPSALLHVAFNLLLYAASWLQATG